MMTKRWIISALLILPTPIGLALAQDGMGVDKAPSLKVIGLYSLSMDREAYSRFIKDQIAANDPASFSEDVKEKLRRFGRDPQPYTAQDRQEDERNLRFHMDKAAAFEVMVTNPDANFNVGKFIQPDPTKSENFWQVAWNEKFLTPDGETLIELNRTQKLPTASQYRIVFVIHFWKPNQPLRSSYGELALPSIQPLPERLWRLTPYELPS
jgi:hypothetical protein